MALKVLIVPDKFKGTLTSDQAARAIENGLQPDTSPRDAPWGERYFHITDPDGHELSFARPS